MANKTFTREQTEDELRKMTDAEAKAYFNICKMNVKMIQSDADRKQNEMHLQIMTAIMAERAGKTVHYLLHNSPNSCWGEWALAEGGMSNLIGYERRVRANENWKIAFSSVNYMDVETYMIGVIK